VDLEGTASMMVGYAMSRADLVIIPCQGSHLDATEAVKAIKLVEGQEKAFQKTIPSAIPEHPAAGDDLGMTIATLPLANHINALRGFIGRIRRTRMIPTAQEFAHAGDQLRALESANSVPRNEGQL
jgi:hypothetical protein